MKVRAIRVGYYAHGDNPANHCRRYPAEHSKPGAGQPFELVRPQHFSPNWMEIVEATDEERAIALKNDSKILKDSIDMTAFSAPPPAPGVKIKAPLVEQLTKKSAKRKAEIQSIEQVGSKKSSGDEEVI